MQAMVLSIIALLASSGLAFPGLADRAACTPNSCLAVLASMRKTAQPDCTSYLATTVTKCPKTVKTTSTITSTIGCPAHTVVTASPTVTSSAACPVTQSSSTIPSYASECPDGAAYTSACSCLSARPSKTTLAAATVTSTVYKTVKSSPTFILKAIGQTYNGYYLAPGPVFTPDIGEAEPYIIAANGTVFGNNGTYPWYSYAANCNGCYREIFEDYDSPPVSSILKCRLGTELRADGSLYYDCNVPNGGTRFQVCAPDEPRLDIGGTPERGTFECFVLNLGAYPVCS